MDWRSSTDSTSWTDRHDQAGITDRRNWMDRQDQKNEPGWMDQKDFTLDRPDETGWT